MQMQLLITVRIRLKNPQLGYKVARMVGMIMITVILILEDQENMVKDTPSVGIKDAVSNSLIFFL